MKTILLLSLCIFIHVFAVDTVAPDTHIFPIKSWRVIDGDTIEVSIDIQFGLTKKTFIRINGINTPEIRGSEKVAGIPVKNLAYQWMDDRDNNGRVLYCRVLNEDKYGGRYVGNIMSDTREKIGDYMLRHKLADVYTGKVKKAKFSQKRLELIKSTSNKLLKVEL